MPTCALHIPDEFCWVSWNPHRKVKWLVIQKNIKYLPWKSSCAVYSWYLLSWPYFNTEWNCLLLTPTKFPWKNTSLAKTAFAISKWRAVILVAFELWGEVDLFSLKEKSSWRDCKLYQQKILNCKQASLWVDMLTGRATTGSWRG